MAVRGVANVAIWGQRDTQYQVLVDPARLRPRRHARRRDARRGDAVAVSGGALSIPPTSASPSGTSPVIEPEDLANTVVEFRSGAAVRMGDVAEVRLHYPPPIGDASSTTARPAVDRRKNSVANTLSVTPKSKPRWRT